MQQKEDYPNFSPILPGKNSLLARPSLNLVRPCLKRGWGDWKCSSVPLGSTPGPKEEQGLPGQAGGAQSSLRGLSSRDRANPCGTSWGGQKWDGLDLVSGLHEKFFLKRHPSSGLTQLYALVGTGWAAFHWILPLLAPSQEHWAENHLTTAHRTLCHIQNGYDILINNVVEPNVSWGS